MSKNFTLSGVRMKTFDRDQIKKWLQDPRNRTLTMAMLLMLTIILGVSLFSPDKSANEAPVVTADTYIPEGFVLVPIEIQNAESLGSLIGAYAVVDLFRGPHSQRVGRRLRLLRAPLNPDQFAVLVSEGEVSALMAIPGPYWAVIQNPQQSKGAEIADSKRKSRIEYFEGN
jgi:hypothetical protein